MLLFRKPLVYYIGSNFLEVFDTNKNSQQKLPFSSSSIQHSEIVDKKKYSEELKKFIGELQLKRGKGVIVLSSELVYASDIDITGKNEKDEAEKFLTALPLINSDITTITLHGKNKLRIVAANRNLYEEVVEILKTNNVEVFSVVPASVFANKTDNEEFTVKQAKKITGEKRLLQRYNLLGGKQQLQTDKDTDQFDPIPKEERRKSMRKQLILLIFSLFLLTGAVGYFLIWSKIIPSPWFKKAEIPHVKPTAGAVSPIDSQPTPTTNPLADKSTIKIQIFNGSGVEGQAGKLSNLLKGVGYSNITIGNTDNLEQRTTILYSKLLPKDMLTDITEAIKNDIPDPTLQEASQSGEFDVLITTGEF